jgi:hypothetical protein
VFIDPRPRILQGLSVQPMEIVALTSPASKSRLLEAVRYAHGMWRQMAQFWNIMINGNTAMGLPGCLTGPALEPFIRTAPGVSGDQGSAAGLRDAVAKGVSSCFAAWQQGLTVPGLVWYPSFVAVAGPMAPPTPSVPSLLSAYPSAGTAMLGHQMLRQEILNALPQALRVPQVDTCAGQLAQSLATYFSTWLGMQPVVGVMGQGPVPSFAPPHVPVGPVVGGTVIPMPGVFNLGGQPPMIVE